MNRPVMAIGKREDAVLTFELRADIRPYERGGTLLFANEFSLSVKEGEALTFRGDNGRGKTTLLLLLASLLPPQKSRIHWSNSLCYHYVGLQGIYDLHETIFSYTNFLEKWFAQPFEDLFSVLSSRHKKIKNLSAGYQQRVRLSTLGFGGRNVWLLDEPFSHLDERSQDILGKMSQAFLSQGGIILSTSHQSLPWSTREIFL